MIGSVRRRVHDSAYRLRLARIRQRRAGYRRLVYGAGAGSRERIYLTFACTFDSRVILTLIPAHGSPLCPESHTGARRPGVTEAHPDARCAVPSPARAAAAQALRYKHAHRGPARPKTAAGAARRGRPGPCMLQAPQARAEGLVRACSVGLPLAPAHTRRLCALRSHHFITLLVARC